MMSSSSSKLAIRLPFHSWSNRLHEFRLHALEQAVSQELLDSRRTIVRFEGLSSSIPLKEVEYIPVIWVSGQGVVDGSGLRGRLFGGPGIDSF